MFEFLVTTEGDSQLVRELSLIPTRTDKASFEMFRKIGVWMQREYTKNMKAGMGPDKKALKQCAAWPRIAGITHRGKSKEAVSARVPLRNTGTMMRSVGSVEVTPQKLVFGFEGEQLQKATAQQQGLQGELRLRQSPIPGVYSGIVKAKDGHQYIRVWNETGWIMRQVSKGKTPVRPLARPFFYLSRHQIEEIEKRAERMPEEIVPK
jgi:hypothetical protein